jgi:hypothetical protein
MRERHTAPPAPKKAKVEAHIVEKDDDTDESMSTILQNVTMSSDEENDTSSTYDWIEDSGSTSHVVNKQTLLTNFVPKIETITGFGGNKVQSHSCGTATLLSQIGKKIFKIILAHVYYVPQSRNNILSTKHLDKQGTTIMHQNGHALIYNKHKQLIIKGKLKHLYMLHVKPILNEITNIAINKQPASWTEWHKQFGHISISGLQLLHKRRLVDNFHLKGNTKIVDCDACAKAKLARTPFPKHHMIKSTVPGERTHTDVWGPSCKSSVDSAKYYLLCVNDYSRYVCNYISYERKK